MEQQKEASTLGMWVFLGTEIMFFGGMFLAYLVYRLKYYNEFAAGSQSIDITLGTINTVVLICSSLTVALGVKAAQRGKRKLLIVLIILTLIFGLGFLGIKGIEWYQKYQEHHVPGNFLQHQRHSACASENAVEPRHAQLYFSLYFALTGLHALHMIIGVGIFLCCLWMAWKGRLAPTITRPWKSADCTGTLLTLCGFTCSRCYI